jgi:hypothetical protein
MSAATMFAALPRFRFPLGAVAIFVAATLFLSGAVHICTILLIPMVAETDGWSRLAAFAGEDEFVEVRAPAPGPAAAGAAPATVAGLDPLFVTGACRSASPRRRSGSPLMRAIGSGRWPSMTGRARSSSA